MKADAPSPLPPIAGYHPTTLIDWPGHLAAIVFLPRCNLRCRFCHAGPLLGMPTETIPLQAVMDHMASREGWLDGVVICGGEPTVWPTLPALCRAFRDAGLAVKLDTNGTSPDALANLLDAGLVDAVAMDLKAPLDERYGQVCGVPDMDLSAVRRSIDLLMQGGVEYEFRTTVCPAFLAEDEIRAMAEAIAGAARWDLGRFEPSAALDPALREVKPYGPARMEALAEIGRSYVSRCFVRGQAAKQAIGSGRD
ncbi:MAG TPA: anaerobic ribonucleoside-triphosphate reductase activating protein [Phycisphaerae bacterium]|nr:anaerobic ribonucleoside-triphosphate reductase activating protein [Phycisphaerae bacterium]